MASTSWVSTSLSSEIRCCSIWTRNRQCRGGIPFNKEYNTTVCSHVLQLSNQDVTEDTWSRNMLFAFIFIILTQCAHHYSMIFLVDNPPLAILINICYSTQHEITVYYISLPNYNMMIGFLRLAQHSENINKQNNDPP